MVSSARRVSFESLERTALPPDRIAACTAAARHEVRIAIGSATLAVRFSRDTAAAAFAERFGDLRTAAAPGTIVNAVALHGETYYWQSPQRAFRWPDALGDELLVFFADAVALHEYLTTSPDIGLHAAVIARRGRPVALVGPSTAGKSTTAIAAVRRGFGLYSDERCIIAEGRVVPFLRALTLREGGRRALLADPAAAADAWIRSLPVHGDALLRPREAFGSRAGGAPAPLHAVFVIEGRDPQPSVAACSSHAVLPALLRSFVSREAGLERAARLLTALHGVRLFRLRLGAPNATVSAIEATLDEADAGA